MKHSNWVRLCSILLIFAMLFTMAACGKKEKEPEISEEDVKQLLPAMTEEEKEQAVSLFHEHQAEIMEFLQTLDGKTEDEKVQLIQAKLDELYDQGYLMQKATYSQSEKTFTVIYKDGSPVGRILVIPMELPGGDEYNSTPDHNAAPEVADTPFDEAQATNETNGPSGPRVLVLNGFEDTYFRTSYYRSLNKDWSAQGIDVTVDYDVTIDDFTNLSGYDAVIFAMHGSTFNGQPVLVPDEECTIASDLAYYDYIMSGKILPVAYVDGSSGYLVTPSFFEIYGLNGLRDTVIFSETCNFYGNPDYCTADSPDYSMADALLNAGVSGVVGYFNSVLSIYSRDMMRTTMEEMFDGDTMLTAFNDAKSIHGNNDGNGDFPATPVFNGNEDATLPVAEAVPDTSSDPEPSYEDVPSLFEAETAILLSITKQLFTTRPALGTDGLYYLPYTNTTDYDFSIDVTVYYYSGDTYVGSDSAILTFAPGVTTYVPFNFPGSSTTGRLSYELFDIYYGNVQIK